MRFRLQPLVIVLALEKPLMIGRRHPRFGMLVNRFVAAATVGLLLLLLAVPTRAQAPATQDIGENIKQSTNVGPFLDQIQRFVTDRVKALQGPDAAAQSQAREDLVRQVQPGAGGGQLTAQFLAAYAGVVNDALLPLAQHKDARVRLNAAIVAAKVAEGARNARLLPMTQALLKDASDGVVLWGLRAARAVLPSSLAGGGDQLVPVIVQIGQSRPRVINAVYEALTLANLNPKDLAVTVPALHNVLKARVASYRNSVPFDPYADVRATTYLVGQREYAALSEALKRETAQQVCDLLNVLAKRAADVTPAQRREFVQTVQKAGGALSVIGQWENNPTVQQLGLELTRVPTAASAAEVQEKVAPVCDMLRSIPRFKSLNPPPDVGPITDDHGSEPPPPTTASTRPGGGR